MKLWTLEEIREAFFQSFYKEGYPILGTPSKTKHSLWYMFLEELDKSHLTRSVKK